MCDPVVVVDCDIFGAENRRTERSNAQSTLLASLKRTSAEKASTDSDRPTGRFISSILGGGIPYAGHVLTQAQRKSYPSLNKLEKDRPSSAPKLINEKDILPNEERVRLTPPTKPSRSPSPEPVVRCSVIQRTPSASTETTTTKPTTKLLAAHSRSSRKDLDIKLPNAIVEHKLHTEPEQDQPIDYHIPKRKDDTNDEKEMKYRLLKRSSAIIKSKPIYSIWNAPNDLKIMTAAAGHGRSNGQGASNQNQQTSR